MELECDEAKRAETHRKHGVDLLEAALIFENDVLERKTHAGITARNA